MPPRIHQPEADLVVSRLAAMSPDVRGCALASGRRVIACTGEPDSWAPALARLWEAAGDQASAVHIGTAEGEVFAHRDGELALVAVSDRFTLAALVLTDMRRLLHDLKRYGTVTATGARTSEDEFVPGAHPDQSLR